MPRVTFVNEHRVVEIEKGTLISEAAAELGIAVCRESFAGTGIGDYTVWVKGAPECLSPVGFLERLGGARGQKRLANRARVLGDCEVTTQGGLANRLRSPRSVTTPDRPSQDPSARKRERDAAGTAAFPYGHPSAVGKGNRPAHARGGVEEGGETDTKQAKQTAAAAVAKAAAAGHVPAAAPSDEAPAAPAATPDPAAEKAARIAEKKARQAALKARLAAGGGAEAPAAEAGAPAAADGAAAPSDEAPAAPAATPDPAAAEKAARIAEKKARQAALKARLAAGGAAEAPAAASGAPAAADGAAAPATNGAAPAAAPEAASAAPKPEPGKSE